MGMILDATPEMGEYNVEVRRESFYLMGADNHKGKQRHAIELYPNEHGQGTAEFLIEDLPKIRAALDAVEAYLRSKGRL